MAIWLALTRASALDSNKGDDSVGERMYTRVYKGQGCVEGRRIVILEE